MVEINLDNAIRDGNFNRLFALENTKEIYKRNLKTDSLAILLYGREYNGKTNKSR